MLLDGRFLSRVLVGGAFPGIYSANSVTGLSVVIPAVGSSP